MLFNFLNVIMLLAAIQGFLLAFLLLLKYGKIFANRFLIALITTYSIVVSYLLLGDLGYNEKYPMVIPFLVGFGFIVPALHYLYTKHMVYKDSKFSLRSWLHFLPFLLYEIYNVLCVIAFPNKQMAQFPIQEEKGLPNGFVLFNWAIILQGAIYLTLSMIALNRYADYVKNVFSSIDKITLAWLRNITYLIIATLFIFFCENALVLWNIHISYHFNLSSVLVAVYVYAIGYLGLFKSEVFLSPKIAESIRLLPECSYQKQLDGVESIPKSEKYEKSGLSKDNAVMYLEALLKIMEEKKPFENPDLTLNQLAEMLSISPHNLSEVLNTQLHQNFFDFINKYRVEKVKKDLSDPQKNNIKLLSIGLDAGFNSKSSFNAIFKKQTQITPSEYRQNAVSGTK
jgi:AraC-like DNA-binding protein